MDITQKTIIGSWLVEGSEIPNYTLESEIYHLTDKGRFTVEYFQEGYPSSFSKLFYEFRDGKIHYGYRREMYTLWNVWFEGDFLMILGNHGMESWMRPVDSNTSPDWSRFYS